MKVHTDIALDIIYSIYYLYVTMFYFIVIKIIISIGDGAEHYYPYETVLYGTNLRMNVRANVLFYFLVFRVSLFISFFILNLSFSLLSYFILLILNSWVTGHDNG